MSCIFRNKYIPNLNKFEIQAYDSVTGLPVPLEDCESCPDYQTECRESQEWTYGIDNTGTTYDWPNATYELTLSDGSTLQWVQTTASNAGWSAQLTEWSNNIQAAADAINLNWLVEPRAVNNAVPSDISGGYGANSSPTGLPGAPSVNIAQGLIDGGMGARYVNIQICTGDPVPVSAKVISHDDSPRFAGSYDNNGRAELQLVTAGAILGEKLRFKVCQECKEGGDEWLIEDGKNNWRKATEGEIPFCYEPCGTLVTAPPPPDSDCTFFVETFCDSNNETDNTLFTQSVTRKVTYCSGQPTFIEYFVPDPADPSAFLPYDLVGQFVDCVTGQSVDVPNPECNDFVIETLYSLEEPVTGTLRNREWHDTAPVTSINSPTPTEDGRNFRESHDFSLPTTTDTTVSTLALNDTNNTAAELDIQVIEGYIIVDRQLDLRYAGGSEGYWAVELGKCCGELELITENGGFSPDRNMPFTLPAGIHKIRLWNIDSGGSNSSANLQLSTDGGITYVTDNTPPGVQLSQTKPNELCKKVKICKDSGAFIDLLTDEVLNKSECYSCSKVCTPTPSCNCEGSGSAELPLTIRTIA